MSTIAVVADIHGNLVALEAVIADIQRRGIETVVNLGDHASGPLWPHETLARLMEQPWLHIAGNHDRQLAFQPASEHGDSDRYAFERIDAKQLAWLRALPPQAWLTPDVLLCHGTPTDDSRYLLETVEHGTIRLARHGELAERLAGTDARLVLCAHSHVPRVVQASDTTLVVNPGSVGCPAYIDDQPEPHAVENGSPHARYALIDQDHGWHVEFVSLPYDHLCAAEQAMRVGREEWARGLRTGYVQE